MNRPLRYSKGGETQGRCYICSVRHIWPRAKGPRIGDAKCPDCGHDLHRTTHLTRCPVKEWPLGLGVSAQPTPCQQQQANAGATATKAQRTPGPFYNPVHPTRTPREAFRHATGDEQREMFSFLMDENQNHVARIAELEAALLAAEQQFAALSGSIHSYRRPSNDPHGRILLDCYEMAKACSRAARAARAARKGKA